jgi:hypothetical protein
VSDRHLDDRAAIEAVIRQYGRAVDTRSVEAVVDCFTPDAQLEYFGGTVTLSGHAEIRGFFDFSRSGGLPGFDTIVSTTHIWQIDEIEFGLVVGHARVSSTCIAYLLGVNDGQTELATRGIRYIDEIDNHEHCWRISARRHEPLWETRLPASSPALNSEHDQ